MLKLTTVVVTYNRKELLLQNIKAQLEQTYPISTLMIVDNNSTDGTFEFLKENGIIDLENVLYLNTGANLGGAGGFEYAIRKAYELDGDVICLMDDDGRPLDKDSFRLVMEKVPYKEDEKATPIFLNCMVIKNDTELTFPLTETIKTVAQAKEIAENGVCINTGSPFNGTFINKALVDAIGYPRGEFFIRYDESDYYTKALNAGAFVGVVVSAPYFHPSGLVYEKKKFLGKVFENTFEAPWKEYYKFRNLHVLFLERGFTKFQIYKSYLKKLIALYLFDVKDRGTIKKFIKKGYKDAINNRLGKLVEPGQKTL